MSQELKDIKTVDYIFFAAYLQSDDEQKMCDGNGKMLKNSLSALDMTEAFKGLKRVVLVTGAKQYGVHLGQIKCPAEESDPRLTQEKGWPSNF